MRSLTVLVCLTMFAACGSSEKFHADGSDEDAAIDSTDDAGHDVTAEVLPDETEPPECSRNSDCEDGDPCTVDRCESGVCTYADICECSVDADCEDDDPCTTDTCLAGHCRREPRVDLTLEVVEPDDSPTIIDIGDQVLMRLRLTPSIDLEISHMAWNIGADCSGDGLIEKDPVTGVYHDEGGHCDSAYFQLEGTWDDNFHEDLLLDVEVRVTGATILGPIPRPLESAPSPADDNITLRFTDALFLEAGVSQELVLIADIFTTSDLRANVPVGGILFASEGPVCLDYSALVFEGLTRINER